jgi:translation initiation factor 1
MSDNDWKKRLGVVYSTDDNFDFDTNQNEEEETLPPSQQKLIISLDKKQRKGKSVSLITGFVGSPDDLDNLARNLKKKCGTGGSSKEGEIIIQGDFRTRLKELLENDGFKVKVR